MKRSSRLHRCSDEVNDTLIDTYLNLKNENIRNAQTEYLEQVIVNRIKKRRSAL